MEHLIDVIRREEPVTEEDARRLFSVLQPVIDKAPDDAEARSVAASIIQRMEHGSHLTALLDWWLVVTTGGAPATGLAYALPDDMPSILTDAMSSALTLSTPVPVATWVKVNAEFNSQLAQLEERLSLDWYGKAKLPWERSTWAGIVDEFSGTITALRVSTERGSQAADIDDLAIIRAAHDEESIILGPVEAPGRTFLFSSSFEKADTNDLRIWEFSDSGWEPATDTVAPGSYFRYLYGLEELDVDEDAVSEVLVQFASNDSVGGVLRFSSGVLEPIGYGEGLGYIPGEGQFGVGNDCDPSCAEGSPVYCTLVWDGTALVTQRTD